MFEFLNNLSAEKKSPVMSMGTFWSTFSTISIPVSSAALICCFCYCPVCGNRNYKPKIFVSAFIIWHNGIYSEGLIGNDLVDVSTLTIQSTGLVIPSSWDKKRKLENIDIPGPSEVQGLESRDSWGKEQFDCNSFCLLMCIKYLWKNGYKTTNSAFL